MVQQSRRWEESGETWEYEFIVGHVDRRNAYKDCTLSPTSVVSIMCAYCYIRFLITSCVHEHRIRIIIFIAFLLPSTPSMIRAHARLSDMMPSASSRCRPRVSSRFQRAYSFVRSGTYSVYDRIFYSGSLLFKLLGVQHNQTLSGIRIRCRINATLEGAFNTFRDTEYQ